MDKKITPAAANKMTVEEAKANFNSFLAGNPKRGLAYDMLLNAIEREAAANPPQGFARETKEL